MNGIKFVKFYVQNATSRLTGRLAKRLPAVGKRQNQPTTYVPHHDLQGGFGERRLIRGI